MFSFKTSSCETIWLTFLPDYVTQIPGPSDFDSGTLIETSHFVPAELLTYKVKSTAVKQVVKGVYGS